MATQWYLNAILGHLVVVLVGVVLLHVRLSAVAKRVTTMERTGVLIEDVESKRMKELKPSSPRQRQRYIERQINRGTSN